MYLELLRHQEFFNTTGAVRVNKSFNVIQPRLPAKETINIFTYYTSQLVYLR